MNAFEKQVGGDHYKEMAIQPIEFCQKNRLGYAESLAIKYICRHGRKNGREDIEKAIHCLGLLLALEYPEAEGPTARKIRMAEKHLTPKSPHLWVNKATHKAFERRQQGFSQSYCYACGKDAHGNLYCADCEAQRGA